MSVGLLIVTHDRIGTELLTTASITLGVCPLRAEVLTVPRDLDPDHLVVEGRRLIGDLDTGDGVLVLTDMYGSTPSNIANRLSKPGHTAVVSGINLPMLIRVLNYPRLSLMELANKAVSGGREGVMLCQANQET